MRNMGRCPKRNRQNVVRAPAHPSRHASGNGICATIATLFGKISMIRYACRDCGCVESWMET